MTTDIDIAAIEAAAKAATPGEWSYRSQIYDDWGIVRAPGGIIANAREGSGRTDHDEHRRLGTDPYGLNAAHIVAAQPRNVLALIERLRAAEVALADARNAALEEAIEMLTCHELYRYRPKAFHEYIDYVRSLKKDAPHG